MNEAVASQQPDALAHNVTHVKLIELGVLLLHRIEGLEQKMQEGKYNN